MSNIELIDSIFEPALICNEKSQILTVNHSFASICNKTTKWFERKKPDLVQIFPDQYKVLTKLIKKTIETGYEQVSEEISDDVLGAEFHFVARCTIIDGIIYLLMHDFSNERRLHSAYKKQMDLLNEFNDTVIDIHQVTRQVTSTLAYKIRAPLSGAAQTLQKIKLAIQNNQKNIPLRELADYLEEVSEISKKLSLVTGEINVEIGSYNVSNFLYDSIMKFRADFEISKDFRIEIKVDPQLQYAEFLCEKNKFRDALNEILKNAYEHNKSKDQSFQYILVRVQKSEKKESHQIAISILNKGERIPGSIQKKMFSPFFSTKEGHLGTGLSMANNLLSQMGASIQFESKNIDFNEFIITVPQINDSTDTQKKKPDIFFISDSNEQTIMFSVLMSQNNVPVICFNEIKTALKTIQTKPNDLIIIDYDLKSFNGLQVARYLHKKFPEVNICLVLDPSSFDNFRDHAKEDETYLMMLKPLYFKQVTKLMKQVGITK